jgi:exodeoxyribonuclease VII small subunit
MPPSHPDADGDAVPAEDEPALDDSALDDSALDELTFADALERLESLVRRLDGDEPPALEEALDAYEEGTVLARECMRRLNEAELRVERLSINE